VKNASVMTVLLVLLLQAFGTAGWADPGGLIRVQMQRQRPGGYERPQQRDFRRPEPPPQPGQGQQRPNGRLTDDERRDLHRDLDRANREIYKGRP
jgi:hypothetical protein